MKLDKHVAKLLKENGFELVRQSRHNVFRHASGALLTVAKSPRCAHVQLMKVRCDIRRLVNNSVDKG